MSGENAGARGVVFRPQQSRFLTIPQSPLCYWLRDRFFDLLAGPTLGHQIEVREGITTTDNDRFLRFHWEVAGLSPDLRMVPKGGAYRKWAGLEYWVIDWRDEGARLRSLGKATLRNLRYWSRVGWTYTQVSRGAMGVRALSNGSALEHKAPGMFARPNSCIPIGFLNSSLISYLLRVLNQSLEFRSASIEALPAPAKALEVSSNLEAGSVALKRALVCVDPIERAFQWSAAIDSLKATDIQLTTRRESVAAVLHAFEGIADNAMFGAYSVSRSDTAAVFDETGKPAGWYPLIAGFEATPPLPEQIKIEPDLLAPLATHPRISPTPDELAELKRRLRALYEAGPGAKPQADDQADSNGGDDDEDDEAAVSGARIPIPAETFLEELSQKLEIHPISVYWMLRELREKDGVVCLPELRRFVSDHFTVMVLRMLGHRWPKQIEANEPVPEWSEPSGIIPVTEASGAETLISRVRTRIAADFGADRVSAIEREFEEIMGVALENWLGRDFFRNHISQFRKRPIAWQIQSTLETSRINGNGRGKARRRSRIARAPVFSCLLYYHRLDDQLLGTVRTQYAHPMRIRMETELRELERIDAKARTSAQEERRADLTVRIEELKDFEMKLEDVERDGFSSEALKRIGAKEPLDKWTSPDGNREHPRERDAFLAQEARYDPDINDGVRVNVAPIQKARLLAADVLAVKDIEKAISDRAEWRADERRWCRDGKLPHPGWWPSSDD